jgi:hypothetical protein
MSNQKILATGALLGYLFVAQYAFAGMVSDIHGNVGYDTAGECDAAIAAGTAKFYISYTRQPSLLRAGETRVQVMTLREVVITQDTRNLFGYQAQDYKRGACDIGTGHKAGRDGVAVQLQGKYVPYSADMAVNVYYDRAGQAVRVTMRDCDNWFGASFPRPVSGVPVSIRPATMPSPAVDPAPVAQTLPPVPVAEAPIAPASVVSAVRLAQGILGVNQFIGTAGVLVVGAILFNGGTTGTR